MAGRFVFGAACVLAMSIAAGAVPAGVAVPELDGPWWQVAGNPKDHPYATDKQQPVDFAIWQAADGTWQIWSCIRGTTAGGKGGFTRFFYRWEGQHLTDTNWKPMGLAMDADPNLGETPGGLQAPYVVKIDGLYHMFYGDWVHICHATSKDGKTFTRVIQPNGKTGMFSEGGRDVNTRDVMLLPYNGLWYAYYTCHPNRQGMDCVRTTRDFKQWSEPTVVAFGGQADTKLWSAECPHVVRRGANDFYLFRTQSYAKPKTSIYYSNDPKMFGINQDAKYFLCTLPAAAPEIVLYQGQYYVAALNEGKLDGIRICKLKWVRN